MAELKQPNQPRRNDRLWRLVAAITAAIAIGGLGAALNVWRNQPVLAQTIENNTLRSQKNSKEIKQVEKRITNVQINLMKIGEAIDRLDKKQGGPGVELERREP